jgi:signal transduction histidine kinase
MVGSDSWSIVPASAARSAQPQAGPSDVTRPSRTSNRWYLRNWRMRWRVLALVLVPTVAALTLGALRVQAAGSTAATASRTAHLGVLGSDITSLAEAVEDERDLTAGYVGARESGQTALATSILRQLQAGYAVTGSRTAAVQGLAGQIGSTYPAAAQADLTSALSNLSDLPELHSLAHSEITTLPLIGHYSTVIATLLAFDNDIAAGSPSAQLAQTDTSIEALAQVEEETSQQRAVLYAALIEGQFEPGALAALTSAQSSETSALASFMKVATDLPAYVAPTGLSPTLSEEQLYNNVVAGPDVDAAQAIELDAGLSGQSLSGVGSAQAWYGDMSFTLGQMRSVLGSELTSATVQADSLQQGAENSEKLTLIAVLVLLLLVLTITIVMARSMILPLRRLRADALDVAGHRLPDMVRRLSQSEDADQSLQPEPIGIDSTDEIGEVARAFDQVHSEAVRLAGDEAMLRANLNAMFVNLSRRSQTLIERQLGIIESLEQTEQDSGRLSSLFRLDHMATRMRRNSENLLVLAGHEAPRKWTQPVSLVDVLRAAVSEIEQYDRISLNVQSGLVIAGRAASDVVHLVAELVENATTFSRKDTQVTVAGQILVSGGVLVEITDEGLGIPEQELAYANWRLDNPPVIDVAVSRRMGLFVVGRLAARHGIKVRLRRATSGGLSALIWVPDTVAETEPTSAVGPRRRFGTDEPIVISSPAQAVAGTRTPVLGTRTAVATRRASIWFDTGEEDQSPEPELELEPQSQPQPQQPVAVVVVEPPPVAPEPVAPPPLVPEPVAAPVASDAPGVRLPIYDSIESEWFRRGNTSFSGGAGKVPAGSWTSPADEGFRVAAQTAVSPVAGQTTSAGLPKRVPSANLVPGSIGTRPTGRQAGQTAPAGGGPSRSPEAVRARLSGFQVRGRDARTDLPRRPGTDEN